MADQCAGEYLKDRPEVAWLGDELRMEVTNSDKLLLFTLIIFGVLFRAG